MSILKLELENFKKFSSLQLDLSKPLTLIYGENSSGKTSALRALLGLMQTFLRRNKYHAWNTHGEYVDLGFYKDYVKDHNIKNRFSISITTDKYELLNNKPRKTQFTTKKFTYEYDSNSNQAKLYSFCETADPKPLEDFINGAHENYNINYTSDPIELVSLSRPKTRSYFHVNIHPVCYLNMYGEGPKYNEKLKRLMELEPQKVQFVDRFVIEPYNKAPSDSFESLSHIQYFTFRRSMDSTDRLMATLYYLGPLRMTPSRSYKISNTPADVGINGEHTPHALAHLLNLHNKAKTKAKAKAKATHKPIQTKYDNFTSWFKLVFPNNTVETESFEDLVRLKVSTDGRADSISDVGFGFSQVLPIIVQAAAMDPGETLIIEQPELHLHPKAQVAFATFMTAAMKTGIKFIIETHSEHILKGLQLQISSTSVNEARNISDQDSISLSHDKVKIYYFNRDDSTKEMKLNRWGEIEGGWPDGFFDESYNISSQIVRNKINSTFHSRQSLESKEGV